MITCILRPFNPVVIWVSTNCSLLEQHLWVECTITLRYKHDSKFQESNAILTLWNGSSLICHSSILWEIFLSYSCDFTLLLVHQRLVGYCVTITFHVHWQLDHVNLGIVNGMWCWQIWGARVVSTRWGPPIIQQSSTSRSIAGNFLPLVWFSTVHIFSFIHLLSHKHLSGWIKINFELQIVVWNI